MPIKCGVYAENNDTPIVCTFVETPRLGEEIVIQSDGMAYKIVRICHWAKEAYTEGVDPYMQIWISGTGYAARP